MASLPFVSILTINLANSLKPTMTVGVALCRRNCHVNPYKIEAYFRMLSTLKQTMTHTFINTDRRRIMAGYSQNSFCKALVARINMGVLCALYMPR